MSQVRAPSIFALACVVALSAPPVALAHASLVRSDPADRAVLAAAPRVVRLFFDDTIRTQPGVRAIRNGGNSILAGSPRVVNDRTLVIPIARGLRRGDYTVLWRVLSDDGHPVAGIVTFGVGTGRARPQPAIALPGGRSPLEIVERWLFLAGVLAASGAALFTLTLRRAAEPPQVLFFVAFVFVAAGGAALVERTSLSTRFGVVVAAAAIVAAVGAAIAAAARRYPRISPGTWLIALALLPAPSLSGHALDRGRAWFELPVDVLHVAASSVWLGGLLALALHMRRVDAAAAPLRRFSGLALSSVAVIAATGVIRAFAELTAVSHVWTTSYGRWLVVKSALLMSLIGLGWVNRYRLIPTLRGSMSRLRRNVFAELLLFAGLLTAVAFLTQTRPDRDRVAILAPPPAVGAPTSSEREPLVVDQEKNGLVLEGTPARAVSTDGRSVVLETFGSDEGAIAALVVRELRTRQSTTLARNIAPQYGLGVASGMVVYATSTLPPRLVAVRPGSGRRLVLTRRLVAPFAWRGERIAWAEEVGARQRIVVRDFSTGKQWVAAVVPACQRRRCYRIDAVTLAASGVVFVRGAIGPQPSFVVRRAFAAPRPEAVALPHDPQPDLVPSSAGAVYYALGSGWHRWDFGRPRPTRAPFKSDGSADPIAFESGRWFVRQHRGCDDMIIALLPNGRRVVVGSPATVRALAGVDRSFCAKFVSLTWTPGRAVTSWAMAPAAHSHEEAPGVIQLSPKVR
jgi:copper transport protein